MTPDQLTALAARLRDHAAMHESIVPCDDEQRQWRDDLLDAAEYLRQCAQAEPVAWLHPANSSCVTADPNGYARGIPLYTHPQPQQADAWREAVIDALVVAHIYRKEHDNDPRKAIQDLLVYEAELAVDPLVSVEARSLIEQGKREAAQADAVEALRRLVVAIIDDDGDDPGNAPGHAHSRPGIWDDDNEPAIAGKPCEKCAAWSNARAVLAAQGGNDAE